MTLYEYYGACFSSVCDIVLGIFVSTPLRAEIMRDDCACYICVGFILSYQQIIGMKHS